LTNGGINVEELMASFLTAIVATVLIPIVYSFSVSANVSGTTQLIILLFPVFIAIGALFNILRHFTAKKY
jgi:TRAP-type C4-dicarboxylate transport system permease small subunit